jgi:hypothetical protein
MAVRPVAREELVYISAHAEELASSVTRKTLTEAALILPETTWRTRDSARIALNRFVQHAGRSLETRTRSRRSSADSPTRWYDGRGSAR